MHGTYNIKSANAQQTKLVYNYKDIKEKLHKKGIANTLC